jgi:prolyl-tRNA synthetase
MCGLFMIHSDDDGLVLPPLIAPYQIVIIPVVREENTETLNAYAEKLGDKLRETGLRVLVDTSDMRAPDKMWKWIKRGVPLRVEIGSREMDDGTVTITRRDIGKESKRTITVDELIASAADIMTTMQSEMYERALKRRDEQIHAVATLTDLESELAAGTTGFFKIKYDLTLNDEFEGLMEKYKISRRCLDPDDDTYVYVAKSY